MDIYEAAGYDEHDFIELTARVEDVVEIVRRGAETLDRDSYVAGMLIGISMERQRRANE